MSEEPRQNYGRGLVDRKLVEAPSNLIAGRPKAAILFCILLVVLFNILARFIVVVSICLVCNFSIVAICPSTQLPALLFVCVLFFVVYRCFIWRTKAELRARVGRPQTSSSPPVIFIAGRPKAALLFWFFGDFRCGALLFMVIHVIYRYKNR